MRVLLIRHAIAEDRAGFAGSDAERALTPVGIRRFRRAARALADQVPALDLIVSSPLRRARETAALLAAAFDRELEIAELDHLAPDGDDEQVVTHLRARRRLAALALVGHEPSVSRLEGLLLTGAGRPLARFKKGGAALIDFTGGVGPGRGTLLWHLSASQLRSLSP